MPPLWSSSATPFLHSPKSLDLRSLFPSSHQFAPRSDSSLLPTRTVHSLEALPRSLASLFRRQVTTVTATAIPSTVSNPKPTNTPLIPAHYAGLNSDPAPGTVAGIVLGSVAGFLLILWLIYTCFQFSGAGGRSSVIEEEVVVNRQRYSRSPSRRRSTPPRSPPRRAPSTRSASEVMEVRSTRERTPPPPRRESRRETVIIEERTRPAQSPGEDIVEVIEENSPPPPPRESRRKSGGFRIVDPEAFGGGSRPQRKVSRR